MKWENKWLPWHLVYLVLLRDHLVLLVPRDGKNILLLILNVSFLLLCILTNGDTGLFFSWKTPFACFCAMDTVKTTAEYMDGPIGMGESGQCFQDLMPNSKSDDHKNSWFSCWGSYSIGLLLEYFVYLILYSAEIQDLF